MLSGTAAGCMASHKLKMREMFMENYIKFLTFVETEIKYSADSILEIISKFSSDLEFDVILQLCSNEMRNGKSLNIAWNMAIKNISSKYGLNKNDVGLISQFGNKLGISDTEGQISNCELNISLINERLRDAREEKRKKSRLYIMLGVFCGISLSLVFS